MSHRHCHSSELSHELSSSTGNRRGPESSTSAVKAHRRRAAPAIPCPNRCLPKDRAHTSYLLDQSTPFLQRLSDRMPMTPLPPLRRRGGLAPVSSPPPRPPKWVHHPTDVLPGLPPHPLSLSASGITTA
jgi:hypothetical protein